MIQFNEYIFEYDQTVTIHVAIIQVKDLVKRIEKIKLEDVLFY